MNLTHIIFIKILLLLLIGLPFAYLFDRQGWFFNYASMLDEHYLLRSYIWSVYATVVFGLIYFSIGNHKLVKRYQKREFIYNSRPYLIKVWLCSLILGFVITLVLLIQNDFIVPGFAALGSNYKEFLELRISTQNQINLNLLNIGTSLLLTLTLSIAIFYLKNIWIILVSIIQGIFLLLLRPI